MTKKIIYLLFKDGEEDVKENVNEEVVENTEDKSEEKETKTENSKCCQDVFKHGKHHHSHCNCHQGSALYGLGLFGALFYFLQDAVFEVEKRSFWVGRN